MGEKFVAVAAITAANKYLNKLNKMPQFKVEMKAKMKEKICVKLNNCLAAAAAEKRDQFDEQRADTDPQPRPEKGMANCIITSNMCNKLPGGPGTKHKTHRHTHTRATIQTRHKKMK